MYRSQRMNRGLGGLLVMAMIGCSQPPAVQHPPTYPVSGRVVRKSGQVVAKGAVQFRPLADTTKSAIGEIQPDGSYVLQSVFGNELVPGAVEGEHEVTVIPILEGSHARDAILLPKPHKVEPRDNQHVDLTIP